jgi:glycosyltransferase involved in cell wall biosynthesis
MNQLALGGAERVMLCLAQGFVEAGVRVDLVLARHSGPLTAEIPARAHVRELGAASIPSVWRCLLRLPDTSRRMAIKAVLRDKPPLAVRSVPRLIRYLQTARPDALLTTLAANNVAALWAAHIAAGPTRVFVREANMLTAETERAKHAFERSLLHFARAWYPRAAGVIAVSSGVASNLNTFADIPQERLVTIYNPLDRQRIAALSADAPVDAWFGSGEPPVILSVGRLAPPKDHATLLRALARVHARRAIRLLILGDGPERTALATLAGSLGIAEHVRMPGFVANPYAYMPQSAMLVLSSRSEGCPNVLLEALACGIPVVSSDCRSGPSELLAGGRFGRLVPVGDDQALADAILDTLAEPKDDAGHRRRAEEFDVARVVERYLSLMLGCKTAAA